MASVRTRGTNPELLVRKKLFKEGFRFRVNVKTLSGSPDIVLKKFRTVIFVHGCFWHGHKRCKKTIEPKTNQEFWVNKIHKNQERDRKVRMELTSNGWKVATIWECDILSQIRFDKRMEKVIETILTPT